MRRKSDFLINTSLLFISIAIGLALSSQILIFWYLKTDQRSGFPRQSLRSLLPLARWSYPDIYQNINDQRILIVGDSYAEGAGDAFLENSYDYSLGHYLKKMTNSSYAIAANSDSDITTQLFLIEKIIEGKFSPSIQFNHKINNNSEILMTFYEGNDIEDYFINKRIKKSEKIKNIYLNPINKFFPIIYFIRKISFKMPSIKRNKYQPNKICIKKECIRIGPMQSASAELSKEQIKESINFTVSRIKEFKAKHRKSMCLVYIPSPATIYSLENIHFQQYGNGILNKDGITSSKENKKNSLYIRKLLKQQLNSTQIGFIDSTNYLSSAVKLNYIHGLKDRKHFNAKGYKLLARYVSKQLNTCFNR